MSKWLWAVLMLIGCLGVVMVFVNRTANADLRPFLGKWTGGFYTDPPNAGLDMKGSIQLYATDMKFRLMLSGDQQEIQVDGIWSIEENGQLLLKPSGTTIEDFGGEGTRNPNLAYIPNEDVRAAYAKALVLTPSPDKKVLLGPLMSLGKVQGEHRFEWGGSGR